MLTSLQVDVLLQAASKQYVSGAISLPVFEQRVDELLEQEST